MSDRWLVIAIDCDDVLIPGTEFSLLEYNRRWKADVPLQLAHTPGIKEWGVSSDSQLQDRFEEIYLSKEYALLAPFEDAVPAVRKLASRHELHMIVDRPEAVVAITLSMTERYFAGCFTSIKHVGLAGDKGGICKAVRADVIIDDNYHYLASAKACGVEDRIWFGDCPWQAIELEPHIVSARCRDWSEVEAEIERIASA